MRRIITWSVRGRHPWIVIAVWIVIAGALAMGPKLQSVTTNDASKSLLGQVESKRADALQQASFPDAKGTPVIVVYSSDAPLTAADKAADRRRARPGSPSGAEPINSASVQYSPDGKGALIFASLDGNPGDEAFRDSVQAIRDHFGDTVGGMEVRVTGPGGLITDVYQIFLNADVKLLVGTVILVLVLLLLIYRSPVLPFVPLHRRGLRLLRRRRHPGPARQGARRDAVRAGDVAHGDPAVRRRHRLRPAAHLALPRGPAPRDATRASPWPRRWARPGRPSPPAASPSRWPCSRCSSRSYGDYRSFAPVLGLGVFVTLIAGLTLMPALLALLGRRAFWPRVPQAGRRDEHRTWQRVAERVAAAPRRAAGRRRRHPRRAGARLPLLQPALQLHRGLPHGHAVQQGYALLEKHFPKGAWRRRRCSSRRRRRRPSSSPA